MPQPNNTGASTVADLIEAIGFAPLHVGPLADSGVMEPGSPIYNDPMTLPKTKRELDALRE